MANKVPSNPTTTATNPVRQAFVLPDLEAARQFGARLAGNLKPGDIIRLEGDLGAGKTEIARSVIQAKAQALIEVPSPTYTLVQLYKFPDLKILHVDLYRLGHCDEVEELGLFDETDAVLMIEWWSRAEDMLPQPSLTIQLQQGLEADQRIVSLTSMMDRWADQFDSLSL